jgi:hypothetical protein
MNLLLNDLIINHSVLAQVVQDVDIIADLTNAWKNFVESGQVWAMLIGIVLGYLFAGFTKF